MRSEGVCCERSNVDNGMLAGTFCRKRSDCTGTLQETILGKVIRSNQKQEGACNHIITTPKYNDNTLSDYEPYQAIWVIPSYFNQIIGYFTTSTE